MTVTIGIHCTDGIVIGADSKRSYGTISSSTVEKIFVSQNKNAIATSAGSINYGDLFKSAVEQLPIQTGSGAANRATHNIERELNILSFPPFSPKSAIFWQVLGRSGAVLTDFG